MKRILSQRLFCSSDEIKFNTVIEIDDEGIVSKFLPLEDFNYEISGTQFFNGIITPSIISLRERTISGIYESVSDKFKVFNLDNVNSSIAFDNICELLIFDCGTENINLVNNILLNCHNYIKEFNIIEIIKALVFTPAKALNIENRIKPGIKPELLLWTETISPEDPGLKILNIKSI